MNALVTISRELAAHVDALHFPSVPFVYNPLVYARGPHEAYLAKWGAEAPREVLMLGMNPGPFGMAQTGVPFGDVTMVRNFVGITGSVGKPAREHPLRPITGFDCVVPEKSGTRFWSWARECCTTAERFFDQVFVANWCPLVFVNQSSSNRTPNKLPVTERGPLYRACDEALAEIVATLQPTFVVGIGRLAETRARAVVGTKAKVGYMAHPSPRNAAAIHNWRGIVDAQLRALGITLC